MMDVFLSFLMNSEINRLRANRRAKMGKPKKDFLNACLRNFSLCLFLWKLYLLHDSDHFLIVLHEQSIKWLITFELYLLVHS